MPTQLFQIKNNRRSAGVVISAMLLALLIPATTLAQDTETTKVNVPPPSTPHEVSSKLCGECHQEIYKEWSNSMHAQSTALDDPIHGAFYRKVMGDRASAYKLP